MQTKTKTVTITIEAEIDTIEAETDTYVVSDDGDEFDDEAELEASDAAEAVLDRKAEYQAQGFWVAIMGPSAVTRFL